MLPELDDYNEYKSGEKYIRFIAVDSHHNHSLLIHAKNNLKSSQNMSSRS